MARILLYHWNELNDKLLTQNLQALGHEVFLLKKPPVNYDIDGEFSMEMMMKIHQNRLSMCISFNYIPVIGSICKAVGIPYISWVYDSPNLTLFSKTVALESNFIFTFDKKMLAGLKERGVRHSYHMPLAVDTVYFEEAVKRKAWKTQEVSFVGSLYTNQFNYFDNMTEWNGEAREECLKAIEKQKFSYGKDEIRESLPAEAVQKLVEIADLKLGIKYEEEAVDMAAMALQKKVTVEERRELLTAIAQEFALAVYTDSDTAGLPDLKNEGKVDYLTEMPAVFANSRINLNITLRSIESGIPLRALDILACGGFLLSNYQPELAEYFEEGKELALFYDKEDCLNKIRYYLTHEAEREAIARAGQKKVKEQFSYAKKLKEMLAIVEEHSKA